MQRLLIVGCGDVARRLLPQLVKRYRVYALVREFEDELRALGVIQIRGDLDHRASLKRLTGLADLVFHFAPPEEFSAVAEASANANAKDQRSRHLLANLRRGRPPKRLVYISTSGIYGDCGGALIDETRWINARTARGQRRVDAERQLREFGRACGTCVSIVRAPGIYAGDRLPVERLKRGDPVLDARADPYSNHVHAEDLGRACLAALRFGRPNRAYHASDDSNLRMGEYFDLVADRVGLPRPPRVSLTEARQKLSVGMLSFMLESRRMSNRRLKRELRFAFRYPTVADGLNRLS